MKIFIHYPGDESGPNIVVAETKKEAIRMLEDDGYEYYDDEEIEGYDIKPGMVL